MLISIINEVAATLTGANQGALLVVELVALTAWNLRDGHMSRRELVAEACCAAAQTAQIILMS